MPVPPSQYDPVDRAAFFALAEAGETDQVWMLRRRAAEPLRSVVRVEKTVGVRRNGKAVQGPKTVRQGLS